MVRSSQDACRSRTVAQEMLTMVENAQDACRSRAVAQEMLTIAAPGFSVAALDLFKVGDRLRLGLRLLR